MYKIVLLGRPNVGKSTLFNRLIRSNRAITHDRAGITRDRMEGTIRNRFHRPFIIVDTGGITLDNHSAVAEGPAGLRGFETEILRQAEEALKEACGICLVVDGRDGLTPFDEHLANYLRRLGKPLLLVVNKVDGMEREDIMCADFHILGFPMVAVSAEHGNQIRYVESLMVDMLPAIPDDDEEAIMSGILAEDDDSEHSEKRNRKAKGRKKKAKADKEELVQADAYIEEGLAAKAGKSDEALDADEEGDSEDYLVDFDESLVVGGMDSDSEMELEESDENDESEVSEEEVAAIDIGTPLVEKPKRKVGPLKICLLGRPNAGKSSILNAFFGDDRMIVSELAGTTRDSVDVPLQWQGNTYIFVDTAGVRRRTKISDIVERFSVNSSLKSTSKADVTFLVIDALQGLTAQDKRLIELLNERKTPFLIILNKMDLVPPSARKSLQKQFADTLAFCQHVPVIQTSAKTRYGLKVLLPMAEQIKAECYVRIGTGQLNRAMEVVMTKHQPPVVRRVRPKFYYLTQAESEPPTFVFFVNDAERVGDSYVRYLEKALRRLFSIAHAPMRVHMRSSHKKKSDRRVSKKAKSEIDEQKPISQYIDQKPKRDDQKLSDGKVKGDSKGRAGKARANPKDRTTLKAALRNPSSIQSRSLKKTLRKKKK